MAIGYGELKSINRSSGRSSVAAAAYRAHERLTDERTGEIFDFTPRQKTAIAESFLIFPDGEKIVDRAALWNISEAAENRKNSTTAREWIGALPKEISNENQRKIAESFARFLTEAHGVACDASIHRNDPENPHLHLLFTTRRFLGGKLGEKTRELDVKGTSSQCVESMREQWQKLTNEALAKAGFSTAIDMRSYSRQGVNKTGERKRTRRQSETQKTAREARRFEREAQFFEKEADDFEKKARRRRDATKNPTVAKNKTPEKSFLGEKAESNKAERCEKQKPWRAGKAQIGRSSSARMTKAKKVPALLKEKFPNVSSVAAFKAVFKNEISGFVGPAAIGQASKATLPPVVSSSTEMGAAAGGVLPPPPGLSPDAYAAWIFAYKKAVSVQASADAEKRQARRLKM